eukprot:14576821-Ditylum_brightwellii.AAC.1
MEDLDVDILVWAETNGMWSSALKKSKNATKEKIQTNKSRNNLEQQTKHINVSTRRDNDSGTRQNNRKIIESRSTPHRLGRWTCLCMKGKYGRKIYIISAYRVAITEDSTNAAKIQHYIMLKKKGVEKPDPKKQFMEYMKKEVQRMKREGEVVLATDMNSLLLDKD